MPATLRSTRPLADEAAHAAQPWRYLVLLSHMRSYSSVLAHVLGSSPQVNGYGESHVRYRNRLAPWLLRWSIRRATQAPLARGWLLDKILHNHIRPVDRVVQPDQVRALIFLRSPEHTLQSLMTLARHKSADHAFNDPQVCCDYYVARLHRLRQDGQRLGPRALYFDAEALVQQPQRLLDSIGPWLGLEQRLDTHYRVGPRSGEEGFGDWLPNIRAGEVLGPEHSSVREPQHISAGVLAEAQAAWLRCRQALLRHCDSRQAGLLH